LGLSRVTTSFCMVLGMAEPWKSKKWRAYDMSTMARAPTGARRSMARARFRRLSAPPLAGVKASPGRSARLGAGGSAPPPARALPSAPPLSHDARVSPPPPGPAVRFARRRRSPGGTPARQPSAPARHRGHRAAAPLIFLFWFESARRRLARDPLRPPPSSRRGRGTGYPHPLHALKPDLTPPTGGRRARGPVLGRSPRPRVAAVPGVPERRDAAPGGRLRRLPFPCEAFTSLQGGTNQPRARPGRRGTAGAWAMPGAPQPVLAHQHPQRAGGARCTLRPGPRASCSRSASPAPVP
jgi:hypothetical protein